MASVQILDKDKKTLRSIDTVSYGIINIADKKRTVKVNEVLPFRIKFTNIQVPGYSKSNPPGIGIAVIGFNNYIL